MGYLLGCMLTQAGAASCWEARALPSAGTVSADAAETLTGLSRGQQLVAVGDDWLCVAGTGGLQCRTIGDRRLRPVRGAPPPYEQLCVGKARACVRDNAGKVFCWNRGEDAKRWTGIGPVRHLDCDFDACVVLDDGHIACGWPEAHKLIKGVERARQVGLGFGHGCALRDDGSVWCWGDRTLGGLGPGEPAVIAQAVEVAW